MKLKGSQILVKLLERQGIECIAGIPGGCNLPLYDALTESSIKHVLARHEQGAGFIAQGMARATGKPAVCFGTSGPGATNLLTAIADARMDSVPIIAITGQVALGLIGTDAFQEIDTYGLTLPITKHNYLVRSARELLEVIPAAFRIAASGRPGPVAIDVPKDVQNQTIEFDEWPEIGRPAPPPRVDDEAIGAMARMIEESHRPLLYAGGGIIHSGASDALRALAEKSSLPAVVTLHGLGAIPAEHPLFLGMLGMHGARYANHALEECDLLIAVGARFDDRATGRADKFCPDARIIHVDLDESELGKISRPHLSVPGDAGAILRSLEKRLTARSRDDWLARVAHLRERFALAMPGADNPRSPYGLILSVARLVGDGAVITTDVGQHQMWTAQAFPFRFPRQLLTSGGLGTMGFGLPAAIGAALARPDRPVVCFTGDGSLLMNIQELAVAVEERCNIKLILLNNSQLGLVRQQQELFYGARFSACRFETKTDYLAIARGFGLQAFDLGATDSTEAMLQEALCAQGPCLIHVPIAGDEGVYPMVPPGAANSEMIGGEIHAGI